MIIRNSVNGKTTREKQAEYYKYAKAAQYAQNLTKPYGTVKNTRRKTDWFGLIAAGVIVAAAVAVVLLTR